jgi:hypothetical protein
MSGVRSEIYAIPHIFHECLLYPEVTNIMSSWLNRQDLALASSVVMILPIALPIKVHPSNPSLSPMITYFQRK